MTIPIFKCEDSLWQMLKSGERKFDMRRDDKTDARIRDLDSFYVADGRLVIDVPVITFLNKATGESATFKYITVRRPEWAPGWCFLILGKEVKDG